jgi:hypothetical protein
VCQSQGNVVHGLDGLDGLGGLDDPGFDCGWSNKFFSSPKVQTSPGAHLTFYSVGTCPPPPPPKELNRPGYEVNHLPPSGTDVKNEWNSTSPAPVNIHSVDWDKFTFLLPYSRRSGYDSRNLCRKYCKFYTILRYEFFTLKTVRILMCSMSVHYIIQRKTNHQQMHKEFFHQL